MKTTITIDKVLVYYDLPQVFVGRDAVGSLFLCLLEESHEEYDEYLGIRLSQNKLFELLAGKVDLRSIYTQPEIQEYYVIRGFNEYEVADSKSFVEERDLPAPDYFIHYDLDPNDIINKEVTDLNKPVFHIGVVDERSSPDVDVEVLGRVLISFKGIYSNAMPKLGVTGSRSLRAFVDQAASFNLHIYADVQPDLFGASEVDKVFAHIDKMLSFSDSNDFIECLRKVRGYSLSHYRNLIDTLITNKSTLKYKYKTAELDSAPVENYVNLTTLKSIQEMLQRNADLNRENIELEGHFTAVSADRLTWTFEVINEEGKSKKFSGKVDDKDMLDGVTLLSKKYKILCVAQTKVTEVVNKETTEYLLEDIADYTPTATDL